ncbi:unnamed protein product [Heterobilharzia americana]|nr:unnamed protein product [Heterobilharzia americana]
MFIVSSVRTVYQVYQCLVWNISSLRFNNNAHSVHSFSFRNITEDIILILHYGFRRIFVCSSTTNSVHCKVSKWCILS